MNRVISYFPWVLILFHAIGFYLFLNDPSKISLTPLNILLCSILVILSETDILKKMYVFVTIAIGGFLVEAIGVHTALFFGEYSYGSVLGLKLFDVPLLISLNWLCIVIASASVVFKLKLNVILKSVLAGLLATLMDVIIEPVAIKYDFWTWNNGEIPLLNYGCWFVFSTLFAWLYLRAATSLNKTAFVLFIIWAIFFSLLNLI